MEKELYGLKDVGDLILKTKEDEYILDFANEIYIQRYINSNGKENTLIIAFSQMFDENIPRRNINISLNIEFRNINYKDVKKTINYGDNFQLVYESFMTNTLMPSDFLYVFCDGCINSGYIKKEINEILNRKQQDAILNKININKPYIEKENILYFDIDKDSCTIMYNKAIYRYTYATSLAFIVERIESLCDKDVVIYGDYRGIGLYFADLLKEKGFKVLDTRVVNMNLKNNNIRDYISKCEH